MDDVLLFFQRIVNVFKRIVERDFTLNKDFTYFPNEFTFTFLAKRIFFTLFLILLCLFFGLKCLSDNLGVWSFEKRCLFSLADFDLFSLHRLDHIKDCHLKVFELNQVVFIINHGRPCSFSFPTLSSTAFDCKLGHKFKGRLRHGWDLPPNIRLELLACDYFATTSILLLWIIFLL